MTGVKALRPTEAIRAAMAATREGVIGGLPEQVRWSSEDKARVLRIAGPCPKDEIEER
jgi:hypothetical protein